jgi:tetratricopeptide (TPR) repeat protein
LDWVDVEFANLRAGFRRATDRGDLVTAAAIAAHTAMMAHHLQRFEPAGWAEEIVPAATDVELPQLPRLYTAASLCSQTGRAEAGIAYATAAIGLEADARYDPFPRDWSRYCEAIANARAGRFDRGLQVWADLAADPGPGQLHGRCGLVQNSAFMGRGEAVHVLAEETLAAARVRANPYLLADALYAYGLAVAETDPSRSLDAFHEALVTTDEHRISYLGVLIAREAARVEGHHGDRERALTLFDYVIDAFSRSANDVSLALSLAYVAAFFDRAGRPEVAATLCGVVTHLTASVFRGHSRVISHLRAVIGDERFERCAATGAGMKLGDAARYARDQIRLARERPKNPSERT